MLFGAAYTAKEAKNISNVSDIMLALVKAKPQPRKAGTTSTSQAR